MKKFVTLLLTAALAITAATTAFAADGTIDVGPTTTSHPDTSVTYEVDAKYTVTIPTSVMLNGTAASEAKVEATNVTIPYNHKIEVTLKSSTGFKVKTTEGAELPYIVKNGNTVVSNDDVILNVESGSGSTKLTFALDSNSAIKYSGNYKDTVTFTVSVKPTQTTNP